MVSIYRYIQFHKQNAASHKLHMWIDRIQIIPRRQKENSARRNRLRNGTRKRSGKFPLNGIIKSNRLDRSVRNFFSRNHFCNVRRTIQNIAHRYKIRRRRFTENYRFLNGACFRINNRDVTVINRNNYRSINPHGNCAFQPGRPTASCAGAKRALRS